MTLLAIALSFLLQIQPPSDPYWYSAELTKCYDGDTCTVELDLGLNIAAKDVTLRLYGVNTPELRGEDRIAGAAARDWLLDRLAGHDLMVHTIKDKSGKYGRLLAELWVDCGDRWCNVNQEMIEQGLAERYGG